jgi:anhydro-N-acetylmuramic acid kinase
VVIDACMEQIFGRRLDRNGATAARGRVLENVLTKFQRMRFFSIRPPKSCGREEFGAEFAKQFLAFCERERATKEDIIATATALTASTIAAAYRTFCSPHLEQLARAAKVELIAAGGGVRNATLMRMLRDQLEPAGVRIRTMDDMGIPAAAKEAAAFALLGWLTWHGLPGNVPSATGATRAVVLGKVTLA